MDPQNKNASWRDKKALLARVEAVAEPVYGAREAASIARLVAERCDEVSDEMLRDLAAHRPVQYVLGIADFYGLELAVGEGVLIPRPETEELVRWILDDARYGLTGAASTAIDGVSATAPGVVAAREILDIGTGSGAIAISLALNILDAHVTGLDISSEALGFARANNEKYSAGVTFIEGDIFQEDTDYQFNARKLDVIVSNPPYIPAAEKAAMADNVVRYEPAEALFVPDDDPLVFYRAIARFARENLAEKGALYLEVHETFAQKTAEMLTAEGFENVVVREDIHSKPRMIRAIIQSSRNAKHPLAQNA